MIRLCKCGCGQELPVGMAAQGKWHPTCRKERDRQSCIAAAMRCNQRRSLERSKNKTRQKVHRDSTDPDYIPKKTCKVCFNLPDRRQGICKGCGLPETHA